MIWSGVVMVDLFCFVSFYQLEQNTNLFIIFDSELLNQNWQILLFKRSLHYHISCQSAKLKQRENTMETPQYVWVDTW